MQKSVQGKKQKRQKGGVLRWILHALFYLLSLAVTLGSWELLSIPEEKDPGFVSQIVLEIIEKIRDGRGEEETEQEETGSEAVAPKPAEETEQQGAVTPKSAEETEQQGAVAPKPAEETEQQGAVTPTPAETEETPQPSGEPEDSGEYTRYSELTEGQKQVYNAMVEQLNRGKTQTTVTGLSEEPDKPGMAKTAYAVYYDHPEFFWISGGYSWTSRTLDGKTDLTIESKCYDYWNYTTDQSGYMQRLEKAAREVADQARQYETPYEQMLFVHDYLCRTVTYDDASYAELGSAVHSSPNWDYCHTAYGCLVNHLCVCDGYSKGLQLVLQKLGIPCYYVDGDGTNSDGETGGHAWNFLNLDGEYYYIDVTWDDPDAEEFPGFASYDYCCTTFSEMEQDHTLDNSDGNFWYPESTATADNYFVKEGLTLNGYDFEKIKTTIENQLGKTIILHFSNVREAEEARRKLIDEGEINPILNRQFTYYTKKSTLYIPVAESKNP